MGTAKTYSVCGVNIASDTPLQAASRIVEHALAGEGLQVHLCNAYTLSLVRRDGELREALQQADYNLPDGVPVALLGRRSGTAGPVRGPGLVLDVMRRGVPFGLRHFLFGGAPGVAEVMAQRVIESNPGVQIVGIESPPFRDLEGREIVQAADRMRAVEAHIVWVGLGTPRQDYLVKRLAPYYRGVVVPVGAAFDFIAGRVPEAPVMMQGSGLEWLHRLSHEPRRLWRRYLIGNPRFVKDVAVGVLQARLGSRDSKGA